MVYRTFHDRTTILPMFYNIPTCAHNLHTLFLFKKIHALEVATPSGEQMSIPFGKGDTVKDLTLSSRSVC